MTAVRAKSPKVPAARRSPVANVTGAELRAARALLKLSQRDLSRLSSVSCLTIVRIEASNGPIRCRARIVASILSVLSRKGIEFLSPRRLGIGVRLKARRPRRR